MDEVMRPAEIKPKGSSSGYEIPFDVITLPSRGKLYKEGTLAGKDSVEIHYLTAREEDILTSPNLIQSGKMLDVLVKSVLKDKTIDPSELLLGDRNAIVIWLRSTGYGAEYPIQISCRECGEVYTNEFDLASLEERVLEENPDGDGLFSMELPQTKKKIRFRLLTSKDEENISKKVSDMKKKVGSQVDQTLSFKMRAMIREVDGDTNGATITKFVDYMPVKDAKAFRKKINDLEPGIIMEQECTCVHCGETSKEVIPIRENFFWPDSER